MEVLHAMYDSPLNDGAELCFRQATFDDIPDVWRIVYHAYSSYIPLLGRTPPTFREDFDHHVSLGNLWLCMVAGRISAMVVLTPSVDYLLIQAMCVDPDFQGNGLGRSLLSFAENRARDAGLPEIKLYTNSRMERNIRIYRRWGFKIYKREDYPWGRRIHMRKQISNRRSRARAASSLATA